MKTLICFFAFFLFLSPGARSQNLVPNGGFEEKENCPQSNGELTNATGWRNPTKATPDLFCACKNNRNSPVTVPQNGMGLQAAHEGNCYAGMFAFTVDDTLYGEYIQTELLEPLKRDQVYHISFWYSLADHSMYNAVPVGIALTDFRPKKNNDRRFTDVSGVQNEEPMSTDTINWHLFHSSYKAKGGEIWITIGPFGNYKLDPSRRKKIKIAPKYKNMVPGEAAYFYVDEVYVSDKPCPFDSARLHVEKKEDKYAAFTSSKKEDLNQKEPEKKPENLPLKGEKPIVFEELRFESGKAIIQSVSFTELDRLVAVLKENPKWKIKIVGHTDALGDAQINQELSAARAKSVADYLISKGIQPQRITHLGLGNSHPIADNASPDDRAKNRRVEFILTKD